ncbi:acyltransferase family protein [Chloroflexota bacterium]
MAIQSQGIQSTKKGRLLYIDNLRIVLTGLVILHHLAIQYGGPGITYYNEAGPMSVISAIMMTLLLAVNQSFFMGFFFMVSSYFSPGSYDRHGAGPYVKERLNRLGIPLLFYIIIISPLLQYVLALSRGYEGNILKFIPLFISKQSGLDVGPLWFVSALLFFSLLYVLWRLILRSKPVTKDGESRAPGNVSIVLFGVALGLVTFIVRIWFPVGWEFKLLPWQFSHFAQYIAMFIIGLIAYRRGWFSGLTESQGKVWRWVVLAMITVFFPLLFIFGGAIEGNLEPFMGGIEWQSFAYSLWEQLMCVAMVVTLVVWFRKRFNNQNTLSRALSSGAYATYVFHIVVIVLLALALRGIQIDMGLKFILVAPFAVALSFLVGYLIKKLPLARNIL